MPISEEQARRLERLVGEVRPVLQRGLEEMGLTPEEITIELPILLEGMLRQMARVVSSNLKLRTHGLLHKNPQRDLIDTIS